MNSQNSPRHFRTLLDLSSAELQQIIDRAIELKAMHKAGQRFEPLYNRTLGMLFEKSSTRTRVSFEVAMCHLGGQALFLSPRDTQLGRGEPVPDSARVLSRMVDAIMIRNHSQDVLEEFAAHSDVPVINALTDLFHPCQLLADMQTWQERRGPIAGKTVAWIGDGNNMCHSYINAAARFGFTLHIACPDNYLPDQRIIEESGANVRHLPLQEAVENVDLIVTDVWASMGDEAESAQRIAAFENYQVDSAMMQRAADDALFMHCLPAHRGEEVAAEVIDGEQSAVWDEAENRLHAQKALLEFLVSPGVGV